jgi:EmrB/QacA subfamily drug resistance transporter
MNESDVERDSDRETAASFEGEIPDISHGESAAASSTRLLVPITIGATFFMEGLDSTIIATSLPQMAGSLGVSANEIGVTMTTYLISVSMWMAASGWLADRFEAKRVYIAAIALFVIGSMICGFSGSLTTLIAGRFVQGAGGAMMTPIGRLILARSFRRDELVRAMSFMIVPGLLGPMVGPVVGGWITTYFEWPWIFFINLPLGLIGIGLGLRYLHPARAEGTAGFDYVGFLLVAISLVLLQGGLELVAAGSDIETSSAMALAFGAMGLVTYGFYARRRADPILDLRLFRFRSFAVAVLGGSFSRVVLGATLFLFPLYFQLALGASPFEAGILMGVLALGQIVVRLVIDRLLNSLGVKATLIGNSVAMGVLLLGLLVFEPGASLWLLGGFMFVFGLIHSVQLSTLAAMNFSGLPREVLGRATSIAAVGQRLAMALGITLTSIVLGFTSGGITPTYGAFLIPVFALAAIMLLSVASFAVLRGEDGADLLRNRAKK